jgi:hypothetical protein
MNKQNIKEAIAMAVLILFLVGGIVYYTRNPEAVTVDVKTGTRTTDYNLLTDENLKQDFIYYHLRYQYFITGVSGVAERQGDYFAKRTQLATSSASFADVLPLIKEKAEFEFKEYYKMSPDREIVKDSIRIIGRIKQLACDPTFDVENGYIACYDGIDPVPLIIEK